MWTARLTAPLMVRETGREMARETARKTAQKMIPFPLATVVALFFHSTQPSKLSHHLDEVDFDVEENKHPGVLRDGFFIFMSVTLYTPPHRGVRLESPLIKFASCCLLHSPERSGMTVHIMR